MSKKNLFFVSFFVLLFAAAALIVFYPGSAAACTTMLITKGASQDGSMIVAHSDDDELGDQRIIYVPAMDHKAGSKRPIYQFGPVYPRIVSNQRGPGYATPGYPESRILGYIDQVPHTYAYIDGNYGIMNEHQLLIGECTNAAKASLDPAEGRIDIAELSRIALERCKKAKDAVKLIGGLACKLGYYGWGETLLIADTDEGWVFEICGLPDGNSALWVAQKVPDGEVFVAANEFRIRGVDPDDADMMYSPNLFKKTKELNWQKFTPDGKLDWLPTVSPGEYYHPYYCLRRVWRLCDRISPGEKFPAWVEDAYTTVYPFSLKPEKKLTPRDVMSLYRDHYEGTEFDMTKGMAGGPFGTPSRYYGPYDATLNFPVSGDGKSAPKPFGAWERPISAYYMGYSFVLQGRSWLPDAIGGVAWIGPDVAYTTCYMPFYVAAGDLPWSLQSGFTSVFDKGAAWWAFNFVSNLAEIKFSHMTEDILKKQVEIEDKEFAMQEAVEQAALSLYKKNPLLVNEYLTDYTAANTERILNQWWQLAEKLIIKYDEGYRHVLSEAREKGYPRWWLKNKDVGYVNGPLTYKNPEKK